jgi:hypothetical protein
MSNSNHFTESTEVVARLIEPVTPSDIESWTSKPFKFDDLSKIPIELPEYDGDYILTCWDTNAYITILNSDGLFSTKEVLGSPIKLDKEYIIIKPKY